MTVPASAQDNREPDGWRIGLLGAVATNPYIGEDTEVLAYPLISYRKGPLSIGTVGIEYDIYQDDDGLSFSAGLLPRFSGLFSTDAPELDGIDRKVTGDLALKFGYDFGAFDTGLTMRQEVTGEHNGHELILDIGYGTRVSNVLLDFSAGAALQSKDLSAYIWGVSQAEARAGRPAYAPGQVITPFASVRAVMPINQRWVLIGSLRADFLPSEISNSPIIDQDDIFGATLGFSYSF